MQDAHLTRLLELQSVIARAAEVVQPAAFLVLGERERFCFRASSLCNGQSASSSLYSILASEAVLQHTSYEKKGAACRARRSLLIAYSTYLVVQHPETKDNCVLDLFDAAARVAADREKIIRELA